MKIGKILKNKDCNNFIDDILSGMILSKATIKNNIPLVQAYILLTHNQIDYKSLKEKK